MAKRNFRNSKNNGKSNSKRQNYRGNNCKSSTSSNSSAEAQSPTNDPAWYSQNEAMLRDSASYPFNEAVGTPYTIEQFVGGNLGVQTVKRSVPGVLALHLMPTVGNSTVETSAVNTAARKLFATLRAYNNSGNPPYDANDLFMIELSIANAYAYVNMCARLYGVLNNYVYKNRYLPKALVVAMGFDYDDFRDHTAQFRWDLDYMISSLASLWAPGNIPYFAQCSQMYSGYYVEGDDVKDQLYVTVPEYFYQYEEASASFPGGRVKPVKWYGTGSGPNGLMTRADVLNSYNTLVAPLMNNSDVNIISGDVRKAFGDNIIKIGSIPLNYQILPTADLNMLEKFKNANVVSGFGYNIIEPDPTQGYLVSEPAIQGNLESWSGSMADVLDTFQSIYMGGRKVLTTIRTNPLPSDVMEMTRWTVMADMNTVIDLSTDPAKHQYKATVTCGTYVPVLMQIVDIDPLTGVVHTQDFYDYYGIDTTNLASGVQAFPLLSNFKFHPEVRMLLLDTSQLVDVGSSYDLDNYTVVTTHDIDRMNDAALFSLFGA